MYQLDSRNYWLDSKIPIQLEYRNPQSSFPLHVHDFHEIIVIFSGRATHLTVQGSYEIREGDIMSIKPGQSHGYKSINDLVLMNILVKPGFLDDELFGVADMPGFYELFGRDPLKKYIHAPITRFRLDSVALLEAHAIIESISRETGEGREGYGVQCITLFLQLLILLLRAYREGTGAHLRHPTGVIRLIDYIERNFRKPITMRDLVRISSMSESSILRTLKQATGEAPTSYIGRLRINTACAELVKTDKPITDIALDAGFNDSNYFSRCFRKYMHQSPREYRQNNIRDDRGQAE